MPLPSRAAIAALASVLVGAGAASPAQANFVAGGADPAGDSADPHPGRDIVAVGFTYDRKTGHLRGGVRLAGSPNDAPANLTIFAGYRTAAGCNGFPAIGFATQTDLRGADWVRLQAPGQPDSGRASKLYEDAAEEYEATDRVLAGERPNCVIAQLNEPGNSSVVYDVAGPYTLRARPELEVKLANMPLVARSGRARTVRLTLRNPGDASTGRVRLAASRARGLTVQMPRRVPAVRAGGKRTVKLKVRLSGRARATTKLKVTATAADGLRARAEGSVYLSKRRAKRDGGGAPSSGLCFRYTWLPPYSQLVPC